MRFITGEWPLASPASRFCAYCLISVLHLVDLFAHANFFSSFFVFLFLFSPPPSITIVFLLLLLFSPPYYFFSFTSFFPSTLSFLSIAHPVTPVIQIPNKISGSKFNLTDLSGTISYGNHPFENNHLHPIPVHTGPAGDPEEGWCHAHLVQVKKPLMFFYVSPSILLCRRCGMITRREAERLCKSFLGDNSPPRLPDSFAFEIMHE